MSSNTTLQRVLIIAVKKRPCLWNKNDRNYNSKTVKERNWRVVRAKIRKAVPDKKNLTGRQQQQKQQQKYNDIIKSMTS